MATRKKAKAKRKFKVNAAKTKAAVDKGRQGSNGFSYVNMPEGVEWFKPEYAKDKTTAIYYLNVIPFIACEFNSEADEGDLYFRSAFRRGQVGAEGTKIVSPSTFGDPCPMSDMYFKMKDDENIEKEALGKLGTKKRELYYVTNAKDKEGKVMLLDFSDFLFGQVLDEEMASEEYEEQDYNTYMFYDPEEGRTLKVVFKQKTFMKNPYSTASKMELVERKGPEIEDEVIESLKDPLLLLDRKTTKQVKAMMADNDPSDDMDDDDGIEEDLEMMDRTQLKKYIKENGIEITVKKSWDEDDIRDAIQAAFEDDDEEEAEEEDDIPYEDEDEDSEEETEDEEYEDDDEEDWDDD